MNATNSYLETCRYLMGANVDDPGTWADLHRLLGGVRLALTCCVCGRLLRGPMGQSPSVCHHHVCRDCVGGRMRYIKRGCGWCRNFDEFVANGQLECVVRCFRQLCRYLRRRASSVLSSLAGDAAVGGVLAIIQEAAAVDEDDERKVGVARSPVKELDGLEKRSPSSQRKSQSFRGRKRIKIGQTFDDNESDKEICFNYKNVKHDPFSPLDADGNCLSNAEPLDSVAAHEKMFQSSRRLAEKGHYAGNKSRDNRRLAFVADSSRDSQPELNGFDSGCDSEKKPDNFILVEHDYNKCTADQTAADVVSTNWTPGEQSSAAKQPTYSREQTEISRRSKSSSREHAVDTSVSSTVVSTTVIGTMPNSSGANHTSDSYGKKFKSKGKSGCRCALAAPNPGKLTCCGQRCPCYAAFKGCDSCKCRGCRNPRGDPRNVPASLLRTVAAPQTLASTPRSGLNKISAPVT